jgi:hypothetical protein
VKQNESISKLFWWLWLRHEIYCWVSSRLPSCYFQFVLSSCWVGSKKHKNRFVPIL